MAVQIQQRGGLAADWITVDPVLAEREVGWETDTGKCKIGNGADVWSDLGYAFDSGIPDAPEDSQAYARKDGAWVAVSEGGGDVEGPAGAVNGRIAVFNGTTGKLIADGSHTIASLLIESLLINVTNPVFDAGTLTIDFTGKSTYAGAKTLTANVTSLAFSNLPPAGRYAQYELHIKQDATGSRTLAIPASHKALGGSDTAIAPAAGAVTVLSASTVDGGATWRYAMQRSAP